MSHIRTRNSLQNFALFSSRSLWLCCLLFTIACNAQDTATETAEEKVSTSTSTKAAVPLSYDCNLHGMQLEGSTHWMADRQMLFAIAAQGEDINGSAPNYRTFQVYTTHDCNMIAYTFMPGNLNNEPSLLQPNTYEENNQVLCAQGYAFTYCFDLKRKEFMAPMAPKYRSPRSPSGKNQGQPQGLEVRGNTLFAMTKQNGTYAYDLSDRKNIQPVMPNGEYLDVEARTTRQLFVLKDEAGDLVIVPTEKNGKLILQSLLPAGEKLLPRITSDRRSGRYAIARTKETAKWMVFDLKESKMIALPEEIDDTSKALAFINKKLY